MEVPNRSSHRNHTSNMRKKDKTHATHFRSGDRLFCLNGNWFFQTREEDHGPFPTREAASRELKRYVDEMSYFDSVAGEVRVKPRTSERAFADFKLVDKDA
ncbi:MAG: DUF6316 family protein [Pseudomonadales bacterium]